MELVNGNQMAVPCPQCGSPAAVHSIQELADLARMQLDRLQQQGFPGGQQGWPQQPQPGPFNPGPRRTYDAARDDDLGSVVLGEVAGLIGRAIGRRVQQTFTERVHPALAANAEERLRTQIAIAEQHPDVCACLNDSVIFLAGGQRTLPMPDLSTLTIEQADSLVATLRSG
jgi:hypothetical protein